MVNQAPVVADAAKWLAAAKAVPSTISMQSTRALSPSTIACGSAQTICGRSGFCRMSRQLPITVARPMIAGQPGWMQEMASSSAHIRSIPAKSPVEKAA